MSANGHRVLLAVPASVSVPGFNAFKGAFTDLGAHITGYRAETFSMADFKSECEGKTYVVLVVDGSDHEARMISAIRESDIQHIAIVCLDSVAAYLALRPKMNGLRPDLVVTRSAHDNARVGAEVSCLMVEDLKGSLGQVARAVLTGISVG